jgi:membrane protein implicated in regulation of membrane protease activity
MGSIDLGFLLNYLPVVWIAIAVILAIIEGLTLGLATIWFAIGAAVAAVAALLGANFPVQVAVFFVVSILTLLFTRPIAVEKLRVGREKNVTEQMEGKQGVMTEPLIPFGTGLVKIGGMSWTAVGEEPAIGIEKDVVVEVVRIEGVKLIVRSIDKTNGG